MSEFFEEEASGLGVVLEQGRGSLPFALIHGEALVAAASWALGEAGATPVDLGTGWPALVEAGEPFVVHDPLCPMTPPSFISQCLVDAVESGQVVVGVRPVTDTVKVVSGDLVGRTVDRDGLVQVCSPVVLPAAVVAALDDLPSSDFSALVRLLADRFDLRYVEAPASARRVSGADDLEVLEGLTRAERLQH